MSTLCQKQISPFFVKVQCAGGFQTPSPTVNGLIHSDWNVQSASRQPPRQARRSNRAFTAQITVLADISTAPTAGPRTMPQCASKPAAAGIATTLYPVAQARF